VGAEVLEWLPACNRGTLDLTDWGSSPAGILIEVFRSQGFIPTYHYAKWI